MVCFVFSVFKVHVVESSNIADHCGTYALSDLTDPDFQSEYSHALCNDEDKEDMLHTIKQAKNNIMTWKAHQLRSVHQDQAKCSVLEANIKSKSDVFLVQEWAMKLMPRKF